MGSCHRRIHVPVTQPVDNGNIVPLYPLDNASWVWHPDCTAIDHAALRFTNDFTVDAPTACELHVSGDQRFELYLDGELLGRGPDRGDLMHWAFAAWELELTPGQHRLEAFVWWMGDHAPVAQVSLRGGFVCTATGPLRDQLTTGGDAWRVSLLRGWSMHKDLGPQFVGSGQKMDDDWSRPDSPVTPAVIARPLNPGNRCGGMQARWRLYPSRLPAMLSQPFRGGRIRAVIEGGYQADSPIAEERGDHAWQALIEGRAPLTVPANSQVSVVWDLDEYVCAYWRVTLRGAGELSTRWAESLYDEAPGTRGSSPKGNRDQVAGKHFLGMIGDAFAHDAPGPVTYPSFWWRSGRYLLITVKAGGEPLTIDAIDLEETRYPLANESTFDTDSATFPAITPLLVRGLQMCTHETFMDCPHYEQLMYVGDTRPEILTWYAICGDDRLPQRAIELFDWSRQYWGYVAEHFPSRLPQNSPTYALLWPPMVHDFARWRDDVPFVRSMLPGIRGNLEALLPFVNADGQPQHLPGWPFVDWEPRWPSGDPPDIDGVNSIWSLHLVLALQSAAELEDAYGDPFLRDRWRHLAQRAVDGILRLFWNEERAMLATTTAHDSFSEHAQCLALLTGVIPEDRRQRCFEALVSAPDLHRATVYFSHYLLETLAMFGRGDLLIDQLQYWRDLAANGLKTPQESPGNPRSDCHAWGSHPLYHFQAGLAGIRPAGWGFRTVRIAPSPGPLGRLHARMPHPRGWVEVDLRFENGACSGAVSLPAGVTGEFCWNDRTQPLPEGRTEL